MDGEGEAIRGAIGMLTPEVHATIERSVLCWLATVGEDGRPNVSPKECFAALDDRTRVIAHIASPVSVRNLRAHPDACVSFVDVFVQRGFKLEGRAEVEAASDPRFAGLARTVLALAGDLYPVQAVIVLAVERVSPIIAPSYRLFPHRPVEARVAEAMARYGVRPADSG